MKVRRLIAKMAITLMVFGVGSLAAVIPASPAAAACSLTTSISGPNKVGSNVNALFNIKVAGCTGRYWTEETYLNGPSNDGRVVSYRGDRDYSVLHSAPCRTGTYRVILKIIGDGFDTYREQSKYIRC